MTRALSNPVRLASPEKGVDGRTVLAGDRAPLINDGRIGDFWIDQTAKKLYGPKTATGWPDRGLIRGAHGWYPLERTVSDGTRRVTEVYDWAGGEGTKPATGYKTAAGALTSTIGEAADIRGPEGPAMLIEALDERVDPVTYDTLTAVSEDDDDNERVAVKRLYEPGGEMPVVSKAAAAALSIPPSVKRVRTQFYAPNYAVPATLVGGAPYKRTNEEPDAPASAKFRSVDRFTAEGNHDSANGGWWVNAEASGSPLQFGAKGDGVEDDTDAVRDAIDFCPHVFFDRVFRISARYSAYNGREICIRIPGDRTLEARGQGGIIATSGLTNLLHAFFLDGSNIKVRGLEFTDDKPGVTTKRLVGVASGDRVTADAPEHQSNIEIAQCNFINNLYATDFTLEPGGSSTIEDVRIISNNVEAYRDDDATTASGAINFFGRLDNQGDPRIRNVTLVGNTVRNATNSAGLNLHCIGDFTATGNVVQNCNYAGIECENGSQNGTISGNSVFDCGRGIWVDDSRNIAVSANFINVRARNNFEGGTSREGIFVTREGFSYGDSDYSDWLSTGIAITGNVVMNGRIRMATFGGGGGGQFGTISVSANIVTFDDPDDMQSECIILSNAKAKVVHGNICTGGTSSTITISAGVNEPVSIEGNITQKASDEASVGLTVLGTGRVTQGFNSFLNGVGSLNGVRAAFGTQISGSTQRATQNGLPHEVGNGAPEGSIVAPVGAFYQRTDASLAAPAYLKTSGSSNTGWNSVALRLQGATADRPTGGIAAGLFYYDTTLGKPIWYSGSGWVDATGASA